MAQGIRAQAAAEARAAEPEEVEALAPSPEKRPRIEADDSKLSAEPATPQSPGNASGASSDEKEEGRKEEERKEEEEEKVEENNEREEEEAATAEPGLPQAPEEAGSAPRQEEPAPEQKKQGAGEKSFDEILEEELEAEEMEFWNGIEQALEPEAKKRKVEQAEEPEMEEVDNKDEAGKEEAWEEWPKKEEEEEEEEGEPKGSEEGKDKLEETEEKEEKEEKEEEVDAAMELEAPFQEADAPQSPGGLGEEVVEEAEDGGYYDGLATAVLGHPSWRKAGVKSLVRNLLAMKKVEKEELPARPADISAELLVQLLRRFAQGLEAPLEKFARHLKPALFRRVHVGTMDYMGESHEAYRQTFDFLETTNTWHDTDAPTRTVPPALQRLGCRYQHPAKYNALAERARDKFQMVVKVSHVATHALKLTQFHDWWPRLYQEKYSKLASATVAYLWQFPPSWTYSSETFEKLERLADYLSSPASGSPEARHIVDFRDGSWYREETYDFLRRKRWCLAWLHLNNTGWASNLPSGWTDRVQTTDFCFCRLFGPDGATHGVYDKRFLHQLFDSCPMGTTTYVLFGNRETLEDPHPTPIPALINATDFRTIFTKMDFVERVRAVRYQGECPRVLTTEEQLLINSFYLRFSKKARLAGVTMASPVASQMARKYYPKATPDKRCFEWYFPKTKSRLHLSLHDAKEEEDLWLHLRQLTGLEDIDSARQWTEQAARWRAALGEEVDDGDCFEREESALLNGTCVRFSERARNAGLLGSTTLQTLDKDKNLYYMLSNGQQLMLSLDQLSPEHDLWTWFMDLCRVPAEELTEPAAEEEFDPWKDDTWRKFAGEMWRREKEAKEEKERAEKEAEQSKMEDNADSWWNNDNDSWKQQQNDSWKKDNGWNQGNSWWEKGASGGDSWDKKEDWNWKSQWN